MCPQGDSAAMMKDFFDVTVLAVLQGVAEFLVSGILGGIVARAVAKFLK